MNPSSLPRSLSCKSFNPENPDSDKLAHCTPLECRVWDISPGYRHNAPLERKTIPIVGARFPRPMGWGTQPLRIHSPIFPFSSLRLCAIALNFPAVLRVLRSIRRIRDSDKLAHCTPLECRVWDISPGYRHNAPLERKTIPIVGAGFPRPMGWGPNPYGFTLPFSRFLLCVFAPLR